MILLLLLLLLSGVTDMKGGNVGKVKGDDRVID